MGWGPVGGRGSGVRLGGVRVNVNKELKFLRKCKKKSGVGGGGGGVRVNNNEELKFL